MARGQPNPHLAALLGEADWSAAELARAVNGLGAAQGLPLRYDRTSVAHWLAGSRPRPPVPTLVASAFSRRSGRLVTAEETGLAQHGSSADDPLAPHQSPQDDVLDRLAALSRADTDPARRVTLTGSAYNLGNATAPAWPRTRPAGPTPGREPALVPRATAADLRRMHWMIPLFADLMERHGGAHARTAVTAYVADDTGSLLAAPAPPSLRRELFTGAGQLTHLLGRMTMDAGHQSLAQRYFTASLGLAREAGDRRLYAITLRAMSLQALHLGFLEQSWHLADAAVDTAGPRTDPSTRAFLLSQRGLTHAHARHRREAVSDLATAEAQHDRATSPAGPFSHYPRPGLDYQRGRALLALGDAAQAVEALGTAAGARSDDRHRSSALTRARLAETLLALGRLEESCVHWHVFLDHYPSLRSATADRALRHLHTSLRGFRRQPHAAAVLRRARALTPRPRQQAP
ncbi:tol-pal system YbgF family protein [Streptomyces sp. NPDC050509]|uniref:tol-pal system YbgF family protein n=1 Tax=Streptomyces sp. NPDC050509 TaxID=3365620 RepID=UPI003791CC52